MAAGSGKRELSARRDFEGIFIAPLSDGVCLSCPPCHLRVLYPLTIIFRLRKKV